MSYVVIFITFVIACLGLWVPFYKRPKLVAIVSSVILLMLFLAQVFDERDDNVTKEKLSTTVDSLLLVEMHLQEFSHKKATMDSIRHYNLLEAIKNSGFSYDSTLKKLVATNINVKSGNKSPIMIGNKNHQTNTYEN